MKKKADYFGLSLCDLGSAVFNMRRIMEAEEMQMHAQMHASAYFTKVISTKKGRVQAAKQIRAFVDQHLSEGKEKEVRLLVYFLNRCLGFDTKTNLMEAIEKVDPKFKAKPIGFGFVQFWE